MKPIQNFEGLYCATESGRIFSLIKNRFLNPKISPNGYVYLRLCKDGIKSRRAVHRLIAETFINNDEGKPDVNHKNGVRHDNNLSNLEWATRSENQLHAYRVLKRKSAKGASNSKYKPLLDKYSGIYYDSIAEAASAKMVCRDKIKNDLRRFGYCMGLSYG